MKVFIVVLFVLLFLFMRFMDYSKKFDNPYQVEYYVGVRGSGKTTIATKEAITVQKKGHKCYSNFELFGAYKLDNTDFGFYHIPPNSYVYLDEVSLIFSNREFKSFPKEVEAFIRYCRKYKIYLRMYSQTYDSDIKIRQNCDACFILVKVLNVFTIAKRVKRTVVLHSSIKDDSGQRVTEGNISENFQYDFPTTWKFCYIPRWIEFFNSFEAPVLPHKEFKKYKFINEPYMYSNTHWLGYKVNQFKKFIDDYKKNQHIRQFGFNTNDFINDIIEMY